MAWIKYERRIWYEKDDKKRKHPNEVILVYSNDTGPLCVYIVIKKSSSTIARISGMKDKERWNRLNEEETQAIWYKDENREWNIRLLFGDILTRDEQALMNLKS